MLGQLPGFFSTGELAYIWTHGPQENRLCGCGAQFLDCPFWHQVGHIAFGGWDNVDLDQMLRLERSVNRHRFLPLLVMPRLSAYFQARTRRYADVLSRLYQAIGQVSGARVIVDSTIDPAYGFLLKYVPGLDLRLVHLVRDSRATAFSWTRWQRRTDRVDAVVYQRRIPPVLTAIRWDLYHLLIHLLSASVSSQVLVRYEKFVASPQREIRRIVEHLDEEIDEHDLSFIAPGEVHLETNHTVAGSLMRLRTGRLPVRVDDEWEDTMGSVDRRVVTALTWPFLRLYGYGDTDGRQAHSLQRESAKV